MRGMDSLRRMVRAFDSCRESFLDRFTPEELIKLFRAYQACSWDKLPDTWAETQIQDALNDIYPQWNDSEAPIIGCPMYKTMWIDGKPYRFTDESILIIETAKGRGKYSVRYSFTGKENGQAMMHFDMINIGNGYKKRILLDGKVIRREMSL